ncbi:hypothetical protein J6590_086903, partial [Homalodisca vitripennis]
MRCLSSKRFNGKGGTKTLSHNPTKNRTELSPGFVEAKVGDANYRHQHGQSSARYLSSKSLTFATLLTT